MEARLTALRAREAQDQPDLDAMAESVRHAFDECALNYVKLSNQALEIAVVASEIVVRMRRGGIVMFCGNGGSAADAQHLAAELQGRFLKERAPLGAVALTANSSTLTAIGNDYSFDEIFERQVRGLGKRDDVLIGISTSGNSRNIVRAIAAARDMGIYTLGLTGETGGKMAQGCDALLRVPSRHTARIQEMHIGVGHMICNLIEDALF
jgi:D-sedoheptulose 7-phosphate isomerase